MKTGVVRFVYAHYPVLGPDSVRTAIASECAAQQGRFWEFHDFIFPFARQAGTVTYQDDGLQAVAAGIGLDMNRFSDCTRDPENANPVKASAEVGSANGVGSTPTVFVNDRMIVGLRGYAEYRQAIVEELNRLE